MPIIDLTHLIEPAMPVYPGTEPPVLQQANTIERDGFAEKRLMMHSHTGTHMDAPAHMLPGGKTLDAFNVSDFYGKAVCVDVSDRDRKYIDLTDLLPFEKDLRDAKVLILRTGWETRWGNTSFFVGFPAMTPAAARWIVDQGIKGVGADAISIDRMEDHHFPVHHVLFGAGMFIIENLTALNQVGRVFTIACLPLRIHDADGAPARIIAVTGDYT
jgi:arylformamidase